MVLHSPNVAYADSESQALWEDGERIFRRGWRVDDEGKRRAVLLVAPAVDHPTRASLDRLTNEYELKDELDGSWAVRPLDLVRDTGRTMLVLEDEGGEPIDRLLGAPMEVGRFLRLAITISVALVRLHQRGLVHKDIKPANILFNEATGEVRLTGFGIASRLARERQSPHLPRRSPARSPTWPRADRTDESVHRFPQRPLRPRRHFLPDAHRCLPFTAAEPMEWVHCHLARRPMPPAERSKEIPGVISAIVMKLLAKRAEDRYQTAGGLESDLRSCRPEWRAQRPD
jgi:serine/threonine protein kinase